MKKIISLVFLMLNLSATYGQRTESHKVDFNNVDGFDGYVTFTTSYEGFATQLKGHNANLYIRKYHKATSEELNALKKAGIDLTSYAYPYQVSKFAVEVEGLANIGKIDFGGYGRKYKAEGKSKLQMSNSLGDFTTPNFNEQVKEEAKKWQSNHSGKSWWEETGRFSSVSVTKLYLSDLENEIQKVLKEYRLNLKTAEEKEAQEKKDKELAEKEAKNPKQKKEDDFWAGGKENKKTNASVQDDFWSGGTGLKKATTAQKDDFWAGQGAKSDEIALEKKIAKETNNQYLGEKEVTTRKIKVSYRDHGTIDGDRVSVYHNSGVVANNVTLSADDQSVSITLQEGINRISFTALNQGTVGDNTAEFKIYDDSGSLIYTNSWSIGTGFRGTLLIIKK